MDRTANASYWETTYQARHASATGEVRRYEYDVKRHWVNIESVGHGQRMLELLLNIAKIDSKAKK